MAHCLSPMMPEEEILGELRARLYDLGEARAYAPRSSTLEMYQLSLYGGTGLRITDIIVALLRNQLHATKESPRLREHWTAYRDKLLEALRVPWSGCARNTGSKKCLGGSSGCEVCRYSILSIASQLNTLALGFAGTTFASEGTDREVQGQKNESCSPNNRSSKPDLEAVQKELALTKSKLLEAEENSRCLEKVQELTQKEQQILKIELEDAKKELQTLNTELEDAKKELQTLNTELEDAKKELQTLNTELENAKTEASDIQKNREQYMTAYRNMTETINKCIKVLISDKGNSKARKDIILAVSLEHYDALDKDVTFRLETLSKQHPPDEDTKQRKALEQEALEHQHGRVKTLMKMDKHKEAEETAKSVLDNRRKNLGKDSEKTQDIFKDYCVILEKGVRLEAVEWEYLQVWFDDSLKDDKFRDGAGISLAELSQRRDQIDESALWYRKVAIRRLARLDVKGAANAALKMVATQMSFHLSSESAETLRKIWEKADINLSDDVLSCGQELGQFFVSIGKYKEAKDVLLAVWKALQKCTGDEYIDRRIMTALALVSTIGQLPDDDGGDLDELYKSIADLAKVKGDKKVSLQHQYQLGCVQLSRMNTKEAETTLKAAWEEAKAAAPEGLGANNILTIQIGWSYGQAILSQPDRDADAKDVFKVLCKAALVQKRDDSRTLAQTVANLTIGRSYSELLLADAEACKDEERQLATYKLARDTLRNVWDEASLRVVKILEDRNLDALKDLLWIGDSYGECLTYLSAPTKAIAVLTEVLNLRKKWTTDTSEIETTSELLKEAVVAKSNLKQVDSPKKTMDKPVANDPGKVGQKSGGDAPHLSPSGPNKERAKSPARPAQPKPKPPKARKGRVGLLRYFAGI